jgi:hypothetical protein
VNDPGGVERMELFTPVLEDQHVSLIVDLRNGRAKADNLWSKAFVTTAGGNHKPIIANLQRSVNPGTERPWEMRFLTQSAFGFCLDRPSCQAGGGVAAERRPLEQVAAPLSSKGL